MDPELLVPQPIGVAGELLIGGIQVGRGYLNLPDLTAEKFINYPWDPSLGRLYRSGDLAQWLPNGELMFLGRIDFQIKLHGKRVKLLEIERSLSAPGRDVAVLLRKDFDNNNQRLVTYASPGWGDVDQVLRKARQELPQYMVPSAMVTVPTWPFAAGGKLDRKRLPQPSGEDLVTTAFDKMEKVVPREKMEIYVVEVMVDVLHIDSADISIFDNFFNLGGTSLCSARLLQKLQQEMHVENITVTDVMKHPTPAALVECIEVDHRQACIQQTMSIDAASKDLTTKIGGTYALSQARLSGCCANLSNNKASSKPSFVSQLYPVLTFCGLCFLRIPFGVAMSILIWGILRSLDVVLDKTNNPKWCTSQSTTTC